ncbi:MAG: 3-deoxy-D-manno-octulosonic acid transferase [Candidatus Desulfatibia sp.]|uniref:3-deoxy-D-manno-octulosonic acid transferase n=1 Tax=Candidatus Desulfatibia sp. TaxID=3101189 RepID=UPI002F346607
MIVLYNILFLIVIILGFPLILPIVLISDKRRKTVLQRLGVQKVVKATRLNRSCCLEKKPIWVHALSVGEVLSAEPLVAGIINHFKNRKIFVSASTKTGFEIANERFKDTVDAVFFYPYDLALSVKHMAVKIDPAFVVIVESDIWPNFLFEMKKRNVPVVLVNARLSQRSFRGYKRLAVFSKPVFLSFAGICTQSMEDAERFRALGIPLGRITVTGNIKFEQAGQSLPASEIKKLRRSIHIQPSQKVILAGSTHKGEEAILLEVFTKMKKEFSELLLIVAPRDPERAGSVQRIFESAGFYTVLMGVLDKIAPDSTFDVIVVDVIGVLKKLYALADVAFVGGSLVDCGGHNPLEPAVFCKPVMFGHDMSDFAEISNMLVAAGGAFRVQDAESLYKTVSMLLRDHQKAQEMGKNAFKVFNDNKGAVDKTLKVIEACFQNRT